MGCNWDKVPLGETGLSSSALGLASSFGIASPDLEYAFERGINYFYWGSYRKPGFGRAVRGLAKQHRSEMIVAVQSYSRSAALMGASVESALRRLRIDHADFLILGWWNAPAPRRILDAAMELKHRGRVGHLMVSCHQRTRFEEHLRNPEIDAIMVRYNAAHPGAESEVFPLLGAGRPAVASYTATRWGDLLNPALLPPDEAQPRASDCYRFALSQPQVDICMAGLKDRNELDEALCALDRGPMDEAELAWMKRVGSAVKGRARPHSGAIGLLDRLMGSRDSTS